MPEVANMSESEVAQFREINNNIVVEHVKFEENKNKPKIEPKPIPNPVRNFKQAFHQYPEILEEIKKAGFHAPTPIQCQAWPILLSGQDLIGIAQTGTGKTYLINDKVIVLTHFHYTGKTLAFLLPALIHIDGQTTSRNKRGPSVLIIAPTRELALQIEREIKKYHYRDIRA